MTMQDPKDRGSAEMGKVAGGPKSSGVTDDSGPDRCAQLSMGQLEVLRLVNRHLSSKEIGAELGISSHTVDQRVRGAIQRLGVARRSEAARLVAAFDEARCPPETCPAEPSPPYQRLIHQPPHIDAKPHQVESDGAVGFQIRHADRTGGDGADRLETEQRTVRTRPLLFLPMSTPEQPSNGWSVGRRLVAITGVAIAASFSAGMFLAGLESLARLVHP
jgi:DNA-binding CsgD family transcriptional regulator